MKKLIIAFALIFSTSSYSHSQESQTSFTKEQSDYLDAYIDSVNASTVYVDHTRLRGKALSLILSKKDDELLKVFHTKGFKEFTKMDRVEHKLIPINTDQLAIEVFSKIRSTFPKNRSLAPDEIGNLEFLTGSTVYESWYFTSDSNVKYEISFYFFNNQLTNIGYVILK